MNRGAKTGVITTCVALLAAGGYGAYNFVHTVTDVSGPTAAEATAVSTVPPSSADTLKRAQSFLDSWQAGPSHYSGAAGQTNDPSDAQSALTSYSSGLKLTSVAFSAVAVSPTPVDADATTGAASASKVTFNVTAKVAGGTWTYPSSLDVLQSVGGTTSVDWSPAVLYPKLTTGETLAAGAVSATGASATVVDRHGVKLTAAKYPSLADIVAAISQHGGTADGSGPANGKGVKVVDATGSQVSTATVFAAPTEAKVTTTIDASLQAKAEKAVRNSVLNGLPASVVAIDWRTGDILAVAYANTGSDGDTALEGALAPGSTMKIITSAALFDKAGLNPTSPAPCPSTVEAASSLFKNDFTEPHLGDTITSAFARSCNTAFIKVGFNHLVHTAADTGDLGKEAADVFDLGSQNDGWSIGGGVASQDASVPANPDEATAAADLIGQGSVTMNPLALASIAATVRNSGFEQPIILPKQPQDTAAQRISPTTAAELRTLMRASAHDPEGTAKQRLGGYSDAGAKTGTSEVGEGTVTTNGWFTCYNDRISVGALVQGGTTGASTAGYVAAALIAATE
jgi:hypothetical protein